MGKQESAPVFCASFLRQFSASVFNPYHYHYMGKQESAPVFGCTRYLKPFFAILGSHPSSYQSHFPMITSHHSPYHFSPLGTPPYHFSPVPLTHPHTLESVSLGTRFLGISTIFSFSFNRLGSKLEGMFFGIVPMFVPKSFVRECFVAQIRAEMCVRAGTRAYLRDAKQNPWLRTLELSHFSRNMPTNFEP